LNWLLVALFGYVGLQLLVGLAVTSRVKSESDYLIAGRKLGPTLVVFSMFATWFGAESCIGAAGAVYEQGLSGARADPLGYAGSLLLLGAVFAVPLWRLKLVTLGDLFAWRYGPNVERLAVLLMVPTSILWAAAQIRAFGQVVATSSGLELQVAIALSAGVVILYTAAGGLLADAVTDVLQGGTLTLGLVVLAIAVFATGDASVATLAETSRSLAPLEVTALERAEAWAIPICGSVLAQEIVSRVVAARSPELARGGAFAAGGMYIAIGIIPVGLGLLGARLMPGLEDPEQVLPRMALEYFPLWFYAIFAGALISAILSTVDSALLAAASLVSHNLIVPLYPNMADRAKLRCARAGVFVFGVLSWLLAVRAEGVYALIETAAAFASAGVLVCGVFGLFTKLGGAKSATAALLAGAAVWSIGEWAELTRTPYLASLAAAVLGYLAVAAFEPSRSFERTVAS
jgi:Na+/proline symporter